MKGHCMLTKGQQDISDKVISLMESSGFRSTYFREPDLFELRIGGYAGTGKTFLLGHIRKEIKAIFPHCHVAFVTFTGKASSVLENKLISNGARYDEDYVGTIHGMIYRPDVQWDPKLKINVIKGWKRKDKEDLDWYHIIIIDEASMVSRKLWKDLHKYEKPIIAVGDHGQLPPIGDGAFNLMNHPDFALTEIQRQALDSPIIALSKFIRENGYIPFKFPKYCKEVFKLSWRQPEAPYIWENKIKYGSDLMVLAPFNKTRNRLNQFIRRKQSYDKKIPCPGERVICLKNNHSNGIMNGMIGSVIWVMPEDYGLYRMTIQMDGFVDPHECLVSNKCFGKSEYPDLYEKDNAQKDYATEKGFASIDYFDFGYASSVHKSQGSEWERVVFFEQWTKFWNENIYTRLLYTGVTRASKKLFIIADYWDG
jgi:exodeoxyribonuclease-5